MKSTFRIAIIASVLICFAASAFGAPKGRKLPVGAYIKSAKIEVISGNLERYEGAIALLDSLFMHYGPHAEGLNLMGQIMVDYIDKTPDPTERTKYVERLVAYKDSLNMCCENDDIKKKYKKNCDKFITLTDSVTVKYWREFYNSGIEQLANISELLEEQAAESDSEMVASYDGQIKDNLDSCLTNFKLTILLDDSNYKSYVGIGSAYEKVKDYENAIEWLKKGLDKSEERSSLLQTIAYDYISMGKYCEAIPFMREYSTFFPDDMLTLSNTVICYSNCQMFDSALALNNIIIEKDPENVAALTSVGHYFNQQSRLASDSTGFYQTAGDDAKSKEWSGRKNAMIDSSLAYYARVKVLTPEDDMIHELYATYSAIRGNFEDAISSFSKLSEMHPEDVNYLRYLGDCYINLKDWENAIPPYEKVVAINPDDKEIWASLSALYKEIGDKTKAAEADKKSK